MTACPACGQPNPEAARFCNSCGTALGVSGAAREERKVVSVVFADLVGSTAAAERSDPEDVRAMLAAHYERGAARSWSGSGARSRSSSVTPWWPSSGHRWSTRMTPSAPSGPPSRSATRHGMPGSSCASR